jgi:hypothetical protein
MFIVANPSRRLYRSLRLLQHARVPPDAAAWTVGMVIALQ